MNPAIRTLAYAAVVMSTVGRGTVASADSTYTIDFEQLLHGQIVDEPINGVHIWADNIGGGPDLAVIFDSRKRGTADRDLEGPRIDGRGRIRGSWSKGNLGRRSILGNLLIIQEHGKDNGRGMISTRPDDEGSRPAGSLFFQFDKPVNSFGFDLIDVEGPEEYGNGRFRTAGLPSCVNLIQSF